MEQLGTPTARYSLNDIGEFIITDYNSAKPFSSFLPGIAGIDGVPMWVFYVNRGQCVCSMGIQDKNNSIMEFLPANWAYCLVSSQGFRTFIKLSGNSPVAFYEPFSSRYMDRQLERTQRMRLSPAQLTIEEENHSLNLKFTVEYFTVPRDSYAGLVRILRIQNLGSSAIELEGLDGLPLIVPHGVDNFCLKNMRRTIEAFVEVCNLDNQAPFFKAKVEAADRPDVAKITRGNFYVGFEHDEAGGRRISPVVDPVSIFGSQRDFRFPERFLDETWRAAPGNQSLQGQLPCAMGSFSTSIPAGETYAYTSIIGHASSIAELNNMVSRIASAEYVAGRAEINRDMIDELTQCNFIGSAEPVLDHYVRQNFLDNTMRGGFPFTMNGEKSATTLYLYSRKHGDLERDYNDFSLTPTHFSQGNGNFRDINQNRRCDLFFNPDLEESSVVYFYNLIQLDGFNPLVLKEISFAVENMHDASAVIQEFIEPEQQGAVLSYLEEAFTPGALVTFMSEQKIELRGEPEDFVERLLEHCDRVPVIDHGEGFWTDHWTYNLDLLETYLAIYPDRFLDLLFDTDRFTFYNNPYRVQARERKYVLWQGKPAQLDAVVFDEEKAAAIDELDRDQHTVRTKYGKGDVYRTSLFSKLMCLIVNKLASLDPEGVGVEMEAGKPNWYDALNGLPGLFGSSINETLEIKRHIEFLLQYLSEYAQAHREIALFEELATFLTDVHGLLGAGLSPFEYWDAASRAKELFRQQTRLGVSGTETMVEVKTIRDFCAAALEKLDVGIKKARDPESNTLFTYFRHEVTEYTELETPPPADKKKSADNGNHIVHIQPVQFRQIPLPLFLEGPVHYLRSRPGEDVAREFASRVKASALYDRSLQMYKVNVSLKDEPMEIGRATVFSPGWLENESIWLHMEYKYMLELLRNGLYQEFFEDFRNVCIPFLNPETYGRSILENSSFIVSSAHPDPSLHGNGYVARLSGATAEFIHMLLLMTAGPRPFRTSPGGELQFRLEPALPEGLFRRKPGEARLYQEDRWREINLPARTFSFMFLGRVLVVYHNDDLKDTYGESGAKPAEWKVTSRDGNVRTFDTQILTGDVARDIRDRKITRIDIRLR